MHSYCINKLSIKAEKHRELFSANEATEMILYLLNITTIHIFFKSSIL